MKTLKIYKPHTTQSVQSVAIAFDALCRRISSSGSKPLNGIDLARVRMRSAATPLVRLQLGQWLALLGGHQGRHLMQAREAREVVVTRT